MNGDFHCLCISICISTRLIYKNSKFEVLSKISNNSCNDNWLNTCNACSVYRNLVYFSTVLFFVVRILTV